MTEHILTDAELQEINAEGERLNSWRASLKPLAYLKFVGEEQWLQDLKSGKFYCNTPKYYRNRYEAGVGDSQEAVAYSGGFAQSGSVDPNAMIGPVSVGQMLSQTGLPNPSAIQNLEITLTKEGHEHGWLHCWFVIDEVRDGFQLASLLTDLHRVREEFGCNYAILNVEGYSKLLRRFEECGIAQVRTARVGYSDNRFHTGIACKRLQYQYQREFRFVFSQCDTAEEQPRILEFGDMSEIMQFNEEFSFTDEAGIVHARLTKDELFANSGTFSTVNS